MCLARYPDLTALFVALERQGFPLPMPPLQTNQLVAFHLPWPTEHRAVFESLCEAGIDLAKQLADEEGLGVFRAVHLYPHLPLLFPVHRYRKPTRQQHRYDGHSHLVLQQIVQHPSEPDVPQQSASPRPVTPHQE